MSEDPEIAKIMQKKLDAMINQKPEPKIEPGIIDLNNSNFDQIISAENPTLVDFWAEWCGPCKMIGPILEELATELNGKVKIVKVNVDENNQTAVKFSIRSIPTLMMIKDGQVQAQHIGAASKSLIQEFINQNI